MLIDVDDVCLIRRGQTDRGRTPRDIMLMYNMPTNIGFCGGESQCTSKAVGQAAFGSTSCHFLFLDHHLDPWGFPLPIVNLISIGNWSRNGVLLSCFCLFSFCCLYHLLVFFFYFLHISHASGAQFFPGAIIFVWCC